MFGLKQYRDEKEKGEAKRIGKVARYNTFEDLDTEGKKRYQAITQDVPFLLWYGNALPDDMLTYMSPITWDMPYMGRLKRTCTPRTPWRGPLS